MSARYSTKKENRVNSPLYAIGFSTLGKEIQLDDLPLRGNFPDWLNGTLVRTGPAQFEVGEQRYKHWFDGLAMLHKFSFRGSRVSYANRFIESRSYTEATKEGKISRGEFGTDPCRSIFGRVASLFFPRVTDNANVNVGQLAGKFIAMTEPGMPIVFDPETLRTVGVIDYGNELKGQISTAHPHFDFIRKQAFNYCTRLSRRSAYQVFSARRGEERAPCRHPKRRSFNRGPRPRGAQHGHGRRWTLSLHECPRLGHGAATRYHSDGCVAFHPGQLEDDAARRA
jgi:beta,beta-carotene 9',10'-dioxygenase